MKKTFALFITLSLGIFSFAQNTWKLNTDNIVSKWAKEVTPYNVHKEYPRPQLVRKNWMNLNGLWHYSISKVEDDKPTSFNGKILVPFPVESALSGVKKPISSNHTLWYKKSFTLPKTWKGKNIILNFGAVDWEANVYVNGIKIGSHRGGYDPFSFDITSAINKLGKQEIVISVWDPTSKGTQPRGKQVTRPKGIWYTPVSGIWQTVWVEPVAKQSIASIKVTPNIDEQKLIVNVNPKQQNTSDYKVKIEALDGNSIVSTLTGNFNEDLILKISNPKLWSPNSPFLYNMKLTLMYKGKVIDRVSSYFAMRKISAEIAPDGHKRLFLNNKPLFQLGTLDQGWWPAGLYTAPSDEALKFDIQVTKNCGFNMIRKHVKVEPARWYYYCDKLGMLVWQDMPNGDKSANWRSPVGYDGREMMRTAQSAYQFRNEWKQIIDDFYHFASIIMWVPFNEAWGQFKTVDIINWTMKYDPSRLVNGPSGGNFFPAGHTVDQHQYPGPGIPNKNIHAPNIMNGKVMVLGEFGGLGLPIKGHLWQKEKNWGYRNLIDKTKLLESYKKLIHKLPPLIKKGLAAAVYTQTTDVEGEVNGLITYDREIIKINENTIKEINHQIFK